MNSHNITPAQGIAEALNIQAAMWANKILTGKLNNSQAKFEISQSTNETEDMQGRVRKYLNAGLITDKTYAKKLDSQLDNLKRIAKTPPAAPQSITGSKDGLWSKKL